MQYARGGSSVTKPRRIVTGLVLPRRGIVRERQPSGRVTRGTSPRCGTFCRRWPPNNGSRHILGPGPAQKPRMEEHPGLPCEAAMQRRGRNDNATNHVVGDGPAAPSPLPLVTRGRYRDPGRPEGRGLRSGSAAATNRQFDTAAKRELTRPFCSATKLKGPAPCGRRGQCAGTSPRRVGGAVVK
jgi:hypothetical protein